MRRKINVYFLIFIVIIFLLVKEFSCLRNENARKDDYRNINDLIFTKHVECRMRCRHITKDEIKEILENGKVNYKKSGISSRGDSKFALEGYSHENQHIRVVVAPEDDGIVIITCIDLDREWPCKCY